MTYAEQYERLELAIKHNATRVEIEINEGEFLVSTDEAFEIWESLSPGDPFFILSITFPEV